MCITTRMWHGTEKKSRFTFRWEKIKLSQIIEEYFWLDSRKLISPALVALEWSRSGFQFVLPGALGAPQQSTLEVIQRDHIGGGRVWPKTTMAQCQFFCIDKYNHLDVCMDKRPQDGRGIWKSKKKQMSAWFMDSPLFFIILQFLHLLSINVAFSIVTAYQQ